MAQSKHTQQDVSDLVDAFNNILQKGKKDSKSSIGIINGMVSATSSHKDAHTFLEQVEMIVTQVENIPNHLFKQYKEEEKRPEEEKEWEYPQAYNWIETRLDELKTSQGPYPTEIPLVKDEHISDLIIWGTELWFLRNLQCCSHKPVQDFVTSNGKRLFVKFFMPTENGNDQSHFELLAEKDCIDMVEKLLSQELEVNLALEEYFRRKRCVIDFNKTPMSQSMIGIISPHSKNFCIVPQPSEGYSQMYSIHAYGFFKKDQEGYKKNKAEVKAAKDMIRALKDAGFIVLDTKDNPYIFASGEVFNLLKEWIRGELTKIKEAKGGCSLLTFSILCEGIYGHLAYEDEDENWIFYKIKELLELLDSEEFGLKGVQKVVAIEACQECEPNNPVEELRETIQRFPNTRLLLSCTKDKLRFLEEFNGFLVNFAKQITSANQEQTVEDMYHGAAQCYIDEERYRWEKKPKVKPQPAMLKKDGIPELLLPQKVGVQNDTDSESSSEDEYVL